MFKSIECIDACFTYTGRQTHEIGAAFKPPFETPLRNRSKPKQNKISGKVHAAKSHRITGR